jgi:hypothetical protein
MPDGCLGLDGDELREVVDGIDGAGGVADLPDDDGGDLDRVAVGVVDLGLCRLLVADPGRDHDPVGERVHPLQGGIADGAAVLAEQLDNARLAGHDGCQPAQREHGGEENKNADHYHRYRRSVLQVTRQHGQRYTPQQESDAQHQHPQTGQEPGRALVTGGPGDWLLSAARTWDAIGPTST